MGSAHGGALFGLFGLLSLMLAVIGVYGVMAYVVLQRTTETGVRMALGARAADLLRMIGGQSIRLTAAGVLVGVGIALALTRLISNLLFDVSPYDPATYLTVIAALAGTVLNRQDGRCAVYGTAAVNTSSIFKFALQPRAGLS